MQFVVVRSLLLVSLSGVLGCSLITEFDPNDARPSDAQQQVDGPVDGAVLDGAADALVDAPADAAVDASQSCLTALDCNDGIDCTVDGCSLAGQCTHRQSDTLCFTTDICVDDFCRPHAAGADMRGCVHPPRCTGATPVCDRANARCVECLIATDCPQVDCCTARDCSSNQQCRTKTRCGTNGSAAMCCQTTGCPSSGVMGCQDMCPSAPH